jgi:hypothetical protein
MKGYVPLSMLASGRVTVYLPAAQPADQLL